MEVKAQLRKVSMADITQSDWVRDETGGLRALLDHQPQVTDSFSKRLRARNRNSLAAHLTPLPGLGFAEHWVADVALLTTKAKCDAAGVSDKDTLKAFMSRKFLLHVFKGSARLVALADIPAVGVVLANPARLKFTLKRNKKSEVAVPVRIDDGPVLMTYHIYPAGYKGYSPLFGRHKSHAALFTWTDEL
jgi:hypothetical protein